MLKPCKMGCGSAHPRESDVSCLAHELLALQYRLLFQGLRIQDAARMLKLLADGALANLAD